MRQQRVKNVKNENINCAYDFSEVKNVASDEEVNKYLKDGWRIVHAGGQHIDGQGFNAKPLYIIGKPRA